MKPEHHEPPINPFAPPSVAITAAAKVEDVPPVVRRDGDLMVIGPNAELEPICFVTGELAVTSMDVRAIWQPAWVYLTMIPLLVPYFFVSPWFVQHVSLSVPIGKRIIEKHERSFKIARFAMVLGCAVAVIAFLLNVSILGVIVLECPIVLVALIATRSPVSLSVAYADKDILILRNVHPNCLADLPQLQN